MSKIEDRIGDEPRERGSAKLLAGWGHRGPAGDAAREWATILRREVATMQAPRLVVSGAAFPGLTGAGDVRGALHA